MSQFPPEVYALIDAAIAEDQTFNDSVPRRCLSTGLLALW